MSSNERLLSLLRSQGVAFSVHTASLEGPTDGSERAPDEAQVTVALRSGHPVMLIIGSGGHPDPSTVARVLGNQDIRFLESSELEELFPDCEVGAMPPMGAPYGMPVWVDADLARASEITFPAGRRGESVTTSMRDFERLIWPTYATLAAVPSPEPAP